MFRYQLLIEYVGTNFRGWQIQKKGSTIQGLIQEKLTKLLKEKIILNGSGRTDTGVHAIAQSAHFDCKNKIIDLIKFLKSIKLYKFLFIGFELLSKNSDKIAYNTIRVLPKPKSEYSLNSSIVIPASSNILSL